MCATACAGEEENKQSKAERRLCSVWLIKKKIPPPPVSSASPYSSLFSAQRSVIIFLFPC